MGVLFGIWVELILICIWDNSLVELKVTNSQGAFAIMSLVHKREWRQIYDKNVKKEHLSEKTSGLRSELWRKSIFNG